MVCKERYSIQFEIISEEGHGEGSFHEEESNFGFVEPNIYAVIKVL